jgi:hypothetical protein
MVKFVITGDFQVGNQEQIPNKVNLINTINKINPNVVIHCGDLTDLGEDGNYLNYAWYKLYNFIHKIDEKVVFPANQLTEYKNEFVNKLNSSIELLECLGNHDTYSCPIQPVKNYIVEKFGNIYYKKKYDDLNVYCLSHYPNKEISDWLEKQIQDGEKYVVFFHYPIVGPFSDDPKWWKKEEQDYFYSKIKGTNCLAIYVGHTHTSSVYPFHEFMQYDGSGDAFWIAEYKDGVLTHTIHSNHD